MTKRTDDYDEIVRVMQLYIDAFNLKTAVRILRAEANGTKSGV